ncbi:MAG: nucleotidyltransferase domain-containing protein [Bacteroidota bacterium]|nr:nucleotidyltransferase domain-containing protein [Bacteroidota bacterium]
MSYPFLGLPSQINSQKKDILISFNENSHYGLFELAEMKRELEKIYGREIDLVTRKSVEKSSNYIRSKSILSNLKSIYTEWWEKYDILFLLYSHRP